MPNPKIAMSMFLLLIVAGFAAGCAATPCPCTTEKNAFARWENGPPSDASFFPIAVWLQDPEDAAAYRKAGINVYVGLWEGPTEAQLAALSQAGMRVICELNDVGVMHRNDPVIVGWMHGDEPDNTQDAHFNSDGQLVPPAPIPPQTIIDEYNRYHRLDPTRPIMLNLGQGVANDTWPGRGKDNGNLEVYKEYVKGGDVISFDIYPVSGNKNPDRGNLAQEAKGIDRLKAWTGGKKIIWNCIECTQINGDRPDKITPEQMQDCVWISLVHGSTGLIYFCHQFNGSNPSPKHLLLDPPMLAAATQVNKQIHDLARVLNSPNVTDAATVAPAKDAPVDMMVKKYGGATYIFAVGMSRNSDRAAFHVNDVPASTTAAVYGENREVKVVNGQFQDDFAPFGHHIYVITNVRSRPSWVFSLGPL